MDDQMKLNGEAGDAGEDHPGHAAQRRRILERLEQGPATTLDLAALGGGILKYTGRISEGRAELKKVGKTIHADRMVGNIFLYTIVPFTGDVEPEFEQMTLTFCPVRS